MTGNDNLLSLIGQIYDASLANDQWPNVLGRLSQSLGASGALLFAPNLRSGHAALFALNGLDPLEVRNYSENFVSHDVWAEACLSLPVGSVASDSALKFGAAFKRSFFYQEFLRHNDIAHFIGQILDRRDSLNVQLSLYRPERAGPFSGREHEWISRLAPHLKRAVEIHWRIGALEERIEADVAVFDHLSSAVFLVDGEGRVFFANRFGEILLRQRDGLCLRDGRLAGSTVAATDALRTLIAGAAYTLLGAGMEAGGGLALVRSSAAKRPLAALVSPLGRKRSALRAGGAAAIVFVSDPERDPVVPSEILATFYGLTPVEARMAVSLLQGDDVRTYAEHANVTLNTARWRLKQIFSKTRCNSQSELVRLALRSSIPAS